MSQSAVSVHIRRLEDQVGTQLLERTTRRVTLTPSGATLLGYARTITSLQEEARARLRPLSKTSGQIRIGVSEDFAGATLPQVLRRFGATHPEVVIEVAVGITTDLLGTLDAGQLDIVLGKQCDGMPADRGEVLWSEPLVWAFANHLRFDPQSIIPLAFFPEPCAYRDAALKALSRSACKWRVALVSPSIAGVRAAALAGFAATPLTESMLDARLRAIGAEEGLPALPPARFMMFVRDRERRRDNPARRLAHVIKEYAISSQFNRPDAA
jgi:DNA-binding transcriptional LysR family regulator